MAGRIFVSCIVFMMCILPETTSVFVDALVFDFPKDRISNRLDNSPPTFQPLLFPRLVAVIAAQNRRCRGNRARRDGRFTALDLFLLITLMHKMTFYKDMAVPNLHMVV